MKWAPYKCTHFKCNSSDCREKAVVILASQISPSWCYTLHCCTAVTMYSKAPHYTLWNILSISPSCSSLVPCIAFYSNVLHLNAHRWSSLSKHMIALQMHNCTQLCCWNSLSKCMIALQMQCKLLFERSRAQMLHLAGAQCNKCFDASYLCYNIHISIFEYFCSNIWVPILEYLC